ncbi:hypothetical protein NGRA_2561 [Nosema granulosis]|uniref:Pol polyprotein n=1 Tax=Nosema granulosis TaxID=83296 RepID=A0A9P6GZL8_9MICR|nr:hypothetical protein NGRA_2561 [Nosema granulosis]
MRQVRYFVICEPRNETNVLEVEVLLEDKDRVRAIVDTGSTRNHVSQSLVEELGRQPLEDETVTTVFGNSTESKTNRSIQINCPFNNTKRRPFSVKFYVLQNLPIPMILGNEFLANNDVIINLMQGTLLIKEEVVPLKGYSNPGNEIDAIFYDRICLGLPEGLSTENKEIINKYMNEHKF